MEPIELIGKAPTRRAVAAVLLLLAVVILLLVFALHREQGRWIPFSVDGIETVADTGAAGLALEFSQQQTERDILLQGSLYDLEVPTFAAAKTILLRDSVTGTFLRVPTMTVRRTDITEAHGARVKDRLPGWMLELVRQGHGGDSARYPYNGAGFQTKLSRAKLAGHAYHLYLLDEDNGHRRIIDMHEEVSE